MNMEQDTHLGKGVYSKRKQESLEWSRFFHLCTLYTAKHSCSLVELESTLLNQTMYRRTYKILLTGYLDDQSRSNQVA